MDILEKYNIDIKEKEKEIINLINKEISNIELSNEKNISKKICIDFLKFWGLNVRERSLVGFIGSVKRKYKKIKNKYFFNKNNKLIFDERVKYIINLKNYKDIFFCEKETLGFNIRDVLYNLRYLKERQKDNILFNCYFLKKCEILETLLCKILNCKNKEDLSFVIPCPFNIFLKLDDKNKLIEYIDSFLNECENMTISETRCMKIFICRLLNLRTKLSFIDREVYLNYIFPDII